MGNIYPALFDIIFEVFNSDFVLYPGMLCFYTGIFLIVALFIKVDL